MARKMDREHFVCNLGGILKNNGCPARPFLAIGRLEHQDGWEDQKI